MNAIDLSTVNLGFLFLSAIDARPHKTEYSFIEFLFISMAEMHFSHGLSAVQRIDSSSKALILSGGYVRLSLSYDREKMSTFELKEKSPRCHNSVEITLTRRKENSFLQFKLF